jgi:biopolymer transport protein ExbD
VELNITAFMNLMVILVPFLLITAVFSRITVLELNIPPAPPANEQDNNPKKEFQLVVTIRRNAIEVGDTQGGLIRSIDSSSEGYDFKALSELLKKIKVRLPKKTTASILLEPDISYDTLVQVMDTVRIATVVEAGSAVKAELFPDISIGDAPLLDVVGAG